VSIAIIQLTAAITAMYTFAPGTYPPGDLATWIADASTTEDADPWLMVALAYHESRFRREARTPYAHGVWQLNPAAWGAHPNRLCREQPKQCGWFRTLWAARALHFYGKCGGPARTVTGYRFGHCRAPRPIDFAVVRTRNQLKRRFGTVTEVRL